MKQANSKINAHRIDCRENLNGLVERITFKNEENGFCVLRVKVKGMRELVTVIGHAACINVGEFIESPGTWVNSTKHGLQFKAESIKIIPPSTLEGIEKYLGSGMVKGIGPHFAKKLVCAFGENVLRIIEEEPGRLAELAGIGPKRQATIAQAWSEQKVIRHIMVFLQSYGVGSARAVRIYKTYGDDAVAKVRQDPYRLAFDISGIGFKTADGIAEKLGIPFDSIKRARAGVYHMMQVFSGEGHCAANLEKLTTASQELLQIPTSIIQEAIIELIREVELCEETIKGEPAIALSALYYSEISVAKHLMRIKQGALPWGNLNLTQAIPWVENKTGIALSEQQRQAIVQALSTKLLIITGGPGVGKTTIVNGLLKLAASKHLRVSLCAPTGRAAKRLAEATGHIAKTIHRLLVFEAKSFAFKYRTNKPLPTDVLIVDEMSMVDINLMNHLVKAIPDEAALIMIGDIDQLPSVGAGCVLSDLIKAKVIPTVVLSKIFRQAAYSQIITNAHRINQGELPLKHTKQQDLSDFYFIPVNEPEDICEKLVRIVTQRLPARFKLDPVKDIQVLTPMNRGGLGSRSLNIILQQKLNGQASPRITRFGWTFAPGDKVIQLVNNYDKDVFNGDIGHITAVDLEESRLTINFDKQLVTYEFNELDEISLAYATTIHKSQGSEYPAVVIPLSMQHYMMLARNLVYTGVTRGKKLVIVIGQVKALAMAVKNKDTKRRLTNFKHRLHESFGI